MTRKFIREIKGHSIVLSSLFSSLHEENILLHCGLFLVTTPESPSWSFSWLYSVMPIFNTYIATLLPLLLAVFPRPETTAVCNRSEGQQALPSLPLARSITHLHSPDGPLARPSSKTAPSCFAPNSSQPPFSTHSPATVPSVHSITLPSRPWLL